MAASGGSNPASKRMMNPSKKAKRSRNKSRNEEIERLTNGEVKTATSLRHQDQQLKGTRFKRSHRKVVLDESYDYTKNGLFDEARVRLSV